MNSDSDLPLKKIGVTIFASGNGSNAGNLMHYFKDHPYISINLVVTNNQLAGVVEKSEKNKIPVKVFLKNEWLHVNNIIDFLKSAQTNYIVLAGYLQLLPVEFIRAFSHRILNIHPALLPKFGGKGMYGKYVHQKVFENREKETGITIHEVNERYDEGKIIFQKAVEIDAGDTVLDIEKKVRKLEQKYFPLAVEEFILSQKYTRSIIQ